MQIFMLLLLAFLIFGYNKNLLSGQFFEKLVDYSIINTQSFKNSTMSQNHLMQENYTSILYLKCECSLREPFILQCVSLNHTQNSTLVIPIKSNCSNLTNTTNFENNTTSHILIICNNYSMAYKNSSLCFDCLKLSAQTMLIPVNCGIQNFINCSIQLIDSKKNKIAIIDNNHAIVLVPEQKLEEYMNNQIFSKCSQELIQWNERDIIDIDPSIEEIHIDSQYNIINSLKNEKPSNIKVKTLYIMNDLNQSNEKINQMKKKKNIGINHKLKSKSKKSKKSKKSEKSKKYDKKQKLRSKIKKIGYIALLLFVHFILENQ